MIESKSGQIELLWDGPTRLMRNLLLAMTAAGLGIVPIAMAQTPDRRVEWNRPAEPFHIIDNVYYVGTKGLAAYLIADRRGHVLIDGGLPESAPLIAANIRKLGFRLTDIKYLLINHAHFDHSGGLAELKRVTGARLIASAGDKPDLESGHTLGRSDLDPFPPVKVDLIAHDNERLRIGGTALTTHLTPGHTKGCTSWSLATRSGTILFACSLTVAGQRLVNDSTYPNAAANFRRTFAKLKAMKVDVYLTFHPEFFDLERKRAGQLAGDRNAFRDPAELARRVDLAERNFDTELANQFRR